MLYLLFLDKHNIKSVLLLEKSCVASIFVATNKHLVIDFILNVSLYKELLCFFVSKKLFSLIFFKKNNFGVAVFIKPFFLKEKREILYILFNFLFKYKYFFSVILHNLQNSFNIGACIRSAASLGVSILFITGYSTSCITEHSVRSSCGGICCLVIFKVSTLFLLLDFFYKYYIPVIGVVIKGGKAVYFQNYKGRVVFLFGSEGFGLSSYIEKKCSNLISIPMLGKLNSLNISCAVSIVLSEVIRQQFFNF